MLTLKPIERDKASAFIRKHHRHHQPPQGFKFAISLLDDEKLVGVIVVGRPVARLLQDGYTAEVTRCCTDGTKNACSKLYAAAWRCAKAMGYRRLVTYTLTTEPGTSLLAAGWKELYRTEARTWNMPGREREEKSLPMQRILWQAM